MLKRKVSGLRQGIRISDRCCHNVGKNNNNFIKKHTFEIQSIQFTSTLLKPFQVALNKAIIEL